MFELHPLRLVFLLSLSLLPAVLAFAWLVTGRWAGDQAALIVQERTAELQARKKTLEQDLDHALKLLRKLPDHLADESIVLATAKNSDARNLEAATRLFSRYSANFDVDAVLLLDTSGRCIAASGQNRTGTWVGKNYADRHYFTEAMQKRPGQQFLVGRNSNIPGFMFSSPVLSDGKPVGVVAVKIDSDKLTRRVRLQQALVTDEQGLIIMADNPAHVFMLMPDAALHNASKAYREARYKGSDFNDLPLVRADDIGHPDFYRLDGRIITMTKTERANDGFHLHIYARTPALEELPANRRALLIISIFGGMAAVLAVCATIVFFLRARAYQHRIEQANEELNRLNMALQQQAMRDSLTGCLNRRALNGALEREVARSMRYNLPLSVAMLDIDHFKRVNDEWGHAVGDQALKHLAEQVHLRIRQSDAFARFGGEEFVLLMPETNSEEATHLLDRIRMEVARVNVPGITPPLVLTFSAGVVAYEPPLSVAELLDKADAAMYQAKQSGRNKVVTIPLSNPPESISW